MEQDFHTLGLSTTASLEDASTAYHKLAERLHPDNTPNQLEHHSNRKQLAALNAAWEAIRDHFFDKTTTPEVERRRDRYFSDAELLVQAKANQEYRREQPRGAIRVLDPENLLPGLYEEYERVRLRNLGYIFDGEAVVSRENDLDVITGEPIFNNTIFTKAVHFKPAKAIVPKKPPTRNLTRSTSGHPLFGISAAAWKPTPPATFQGHVIFNESVQFDVPAEFHGPVTFMKKVVFKRKVVFCERPDINPQEGMQHTTEVKNLWADRMK